MNKLFTLLTILLIALPAYAQPDSTESFGQVYLDLPLLSLPAQTDAIRTTGGFFPSYMNPGMENSLAYSADVYTAVHYGIRKLVKIEKSSLWESILQRVAIGAFDGIWMMMPLGMGWLHEEYHRDIMTQYGVNSFNEMLLCRIFDEVTAVSHETDEDMAMLCDTHHSDFVRLNSAGHEGVVDLTRRMQANAFFYHQKLYNQYLYWSNAVQNLYYVFSCATGRSDKASINQMAKETTIASRDFTGMDMCAWIHALCYPDTPYAARGTHPSGVGIHRYIMYDMIPDEGKAYLTRQAWLEAFNFISPMLFGRDRFRLGNSDSYGNFAFRHYLTSFGSDVSLDLYYQKAQYNLYGTIHTYHNADHHFGGLELGLVDLPLLDNRMQAGGVVMGWVQPKDQLFKTASGTFGGLVKARMAYHSRFLDPYVEFGWKSAGWVAGNGKLGSGAFLRAGLRWQIGR